MESPFWYQQSIARKIPPPNLWKIWTWQWLPWLFEGQISFSRSILKKRKYIKKQIDLQITNQSNDLEFNLDNDLHVRMKVNFIFLMESRSSTTSIDFVAIWSSTIIVKNLIFLIFGLHFSDCRCWNWNTLKNVRSRALVNKKKMK